MASSNDIEHIQHLLQAGQLDDAHAELTKLLRDTPGYGDAWAIAAQLTSDLQQCREFLKRVFEGSNSTALTAWAFSNLGDLQSVESIYRLSPPPIESLIVLTDVRVPLDELLVQATSARQVTLPAKDNPSQQGSTPSAPPLVFDEQPEKKPGPLFSVKRLGVWIMLAGGLIFVASVYSESVRSILFYAGLSPLYCCLLPSLILGTSALLVGFFIDKKR